VILPKTTDGFEDLSGLLYRTGKLVEVGIKPIYVFDGILLTLKDTRSNKSMKGSFRKGIVI